MGHATTQPHLSRRGLLRSAAATAGGVALVASATAPAAAARPAQPAASGRTLRHPGLLHTQSDLDRMAAKVAAGKQPWLDGWEKLTSGSHASADYQQRPTATVIRGGEGQNYPVMFNDAHAAYQNALVWRITGDAAHADKARDILNDWAATLTVISGNADRFLLAGIQGWQFANAAELMRDYDGFDVDRFAEMLLTHFYPLNSSFLVNHNDAVDTNYRANWDTANMAAILAIGAFTEDDAKISEAIDYFRNGSGNGNIRRAVPFLHQTEHGELGQWEESGRDQGHTMGGMGQMAVFCEMAWNLGEDLYGYDDSRFMKAAEYVARYNLGQEVPYTEYSRQMGQTGAWYTEPVLGEGGRGDTSPFWALLHNHYAFRRGLEVPHITAYMRQLRPEDGGGHRGPNSGGFDHLGFGTLTFTRDPADAPAETEPGNEPEPGTGNGNGNGSQATPTPSASANGGPRPQGTAGTTGDTGQGADLANSGSDDSLLGWSAAAGVSALAGGLLLLRRRIRGASGTGGDA